MGCAFREAVIIYGMTLYLIVGVVIGGAAGYLLGRRSRPQGGHDLFDPEEAAEFGEAGRAVVDARIERRKVRIMERARELGRITNDGVEELFCISNKTAGNYLRSLTEEGKLERRGEGRGIHYIPAS